MPTGGHRFRSPLCLQDGDAATQTGEEFPRPGLSTEGSPPAQRSRSVALTPHCSCCGPSLPACLWVFPTPTPVTAQARTEGLLEASGSWVGCPRVGSPPSRAGPSPPQAAPCTVTSLLPSPRVFLTHSSWTCSPGHSVGISGGQQSMSAPALFTLSAGSTLSSLGGPLNRAGRGRSLGTR